MESALRMLQEKIPKTGGIKKALDAMDTSPLDQNDDGVYTIMAPFRNAIRLGGKNAANALLLLHQAAQNSTITTNTSNSVKLGLTAKECSIVVVTLVDILHAISAYDEGTQELLIRVIEEALPLSISELSIDNMMRLVEVLSLVFEYSQRPHIVAKSTLNRLLDALFMSTDKRSSAPLIAIDASLSNNEHILSNNFDNEDATIITDDEKDALIDAHSSPSNKTSFADSKYVHIVNKRRECTFDVDDDFIKDRDDQDSLNDTEALVQVDYTSSRSKKKKLRSSYFDEIEKFNMEDTNLGSDPPYAMKLILIVFHHFCSILYDTVFLSTHYNENIDMNESTGCLHDASDDLAPVLDQGPVAELAMEIALIILTNAPVELRGNQTFLTCITQRLIPAVCGHGSGSSHVVLNLSTSIFINVCEIDTTILSTKEINNDDDSDVVAFAHRLLESVFLGPIASYPNIEYLSAVLRNLAVIMARPDLMSVLCSRSLASGVSVPHAIADVVSCTYNHGSPDILERLLVCDHILRSIEVRFGDVLNKLRSRESLNLFCSFIEDETTVKASPDVLLVEINNKNVNSTISSIPFLAAFEGILPHLISLDDPRDVDRNLLHFSSQFIRDNPLVAPFTADAAYAMSYVILSLSLYQYGYDRDGKEGSLNVNGISFQVFVSKSQLYIDAASYDTSEDSRTDVNFLEHPVPDEEWLESVWKEVTDRDILADAGFRCNNRDGDKCDGLGLDALLNNYITIFAMHRWDDIMTPAHSSFNFGISKLRRELIDICDIFQLFDSNYLRNSNTTTKRKAASLILDCCEVATRLYALSALSKPLESITRYLYDASALASDRAILSFNACRAVYLLLGIGAEYGGFILSEVVWGHILTRAIVLKYFSADNNNDTNDKDILKGASASANILAVSLLPLMSNPPVLHCGSYKNLSDCSQNLIFNMERLSSNVEHIFTRTLLLNYDALRAFIGGLYVVIESETPLRTEALSRLCSVVLSNISCQRVHFDWMCIVPRLTSYFGFIFMSLDNSALALSMWHEIIVSFLSREKELPGFHLNETLLRPFHVATLARGIDRDMCQASIVALNDIVRTHGLQLGSGWTTLFAALSGAVLRFEGDESPHLEALDVIETLLQCHGDHSIQGSSAFFDSVLNCANCLADVACHGTAELQCERAINCLTLCMCSLVSLAWKNEVNEIDLSNATLQAAALLDREEAFMADRETDGTILPISKTSTIEKNYIPETSEPDNNLITFDGVQTNTKANSRINGNRAAIVESANASVAAEPTPRGIPIRRPIVGATKKRSASVDQCDESVSNHSWDKAWLLRGISRVDALSRLWHYIIHCFARIVMECRYKNIQVSALKQMVTFLAVNNGEKGYISNQDGIDKNGCFSVISNRASLVKEGTLSFDTVPVQFKLFMYHAEVLPMLLRMHAELLSGFGEFIFTLSLYLSMSEFAQSFILLPANHAILLLDEFIQLAAKCVLSTSYLVSHCGVTCLKHVLDVVGCHINSTSWSKITVLLRKLFECSLPYFLFAIDDVVAAQFSKYSCSDSDSLASLVFSFDNNNVDNYMIYADVTDSMESKQVKDLRKSNLSKESMVRERSRSRSGSVGCVQPSSYHIGLQLLATHIRLVDLVASILSSFMFGISDNSQPLASKLEIDDSHLAVLSESLLLSIAYTQRFETDTNLKNILLNAGLVKKLPSLRKLQFMAGGVQISLLLARLLYGSCDAVSLDFTSTLHNTCATFVSNITSMSSESSNEDYECPNTEGASSLHENRDYPTLLTVLTSCILKPLLQINNSFFDKVIPIVTPVLLTLVLVDNKKVRKYTHDVLARALRRQYNNNT